MAYDEDLQEYVDEDPDERADGRRRLILIILGVVCIALAVSNIVLATRLMDGRHRATVPERAAALPEPAEPPAARVDAEPAASVPSTPPAIAAPGPSLREAAAAAPAAPPTAAPRPRPTPADEDVAPPSSSVELPPRRAAPPVSTARAGSRPDQPAGGWQRERSTASWMVQAYGRDGAEARARAAAAFYDARSPERAYWRSVLAEIASSDR